MQIDLPVCILNKLHSNSNMHFTAILSLNMPTKSPPNWLNKLQRRRRVGSIIITRHVYNANQNISRRSSHFGDSAHTRGRRRAHFAHMACHRVSPLKMIISLELTGRGRIVPQRACVRARAQGVRHICARYVSSGAEMLRAKCKRMLYVLHRSTQCA